MSDQLPSSLLDNLPKPTEQAGDIAKLATGIASAFAAIWFPAAGIAGAVLPIVIDRYVERPRKIMLQALRRGDVRNLSAEQLAPFVPMAYKFLEAAKEGEYEHNLEILAAYLAGEMKQEVPDAAGFSRMVRRIEGLSDGDLKVMALIEASADSIVTLTIDEGPSGEMFFVSSQRLKNSPHNKHGLTRGIIAESLADLAGRGFLVADGATRLSKGEEAYRTSQAFTELMDRARERMKEGADLKTPA